MGHTMEVNGVINIKILTVSIVYLEYINHMHANM